jgi:hypothetical protein
MTYLDINKFYYIANGGSEAPYYLKVKAKTVGSITYNIESTVYNSPGGAATSSIVFNLVPVTPGDTYRTLPLGDLVVGTSKNLELIVKVDGEEKEKDEENYGNAEPG